MALYCNDYEVERDAYIDAGAQLAFEGSSIGIRTCWVDTSSTLGFMVELLEPSAARDAGSPPCGLLLRSGMAAIRSSRSDMAEISTEG